MPATLFDLQKKYGESVYPLYKEQSHEPYMETATGNGVLGEVLYDELEDKLLCNDCNQWFKNLSNHLIHKHKKTVAEYKEEFGILQKAPLVSKALSVVRANNMKSLWRRGEAMKSVGFKNKTRPWNKTSRDKIGWANKSGLCDAQIAARLEIIKTQTNKPITVRLIQKYDSSLYYFLNNIRNRKGIKAKDEILKKFNLKKSYMHPKYEDAEIIAKIRDYVMRFNREPSAFKFIKFSRISQTTWENHFGSWRRAKMMAGVDELLEELNHKQLIPTVLN